MNINDKIYRLYGVNTAIQLLRPGSKWSIQNKTFVEWNDPRPCPTWEEIDETMEKIKAFEDSINTIWTEEQLKDIAENKPLIEPNESND